MTMSLTCRQSRQLYRKEAIMSTSTGNVDLLAKAENLEVQLVDLYNINGTLGNSPVTQQSIEYTAEQARVLKEQIAAKGALTSDEEDDYAQKLAAIQTQLNEYMRKISSARSTPTARTVLPASSSNSSRFTKIALLMIFLLLIIAGVYALTRIPAVQTAWNQVIELTKGSGTPQPEASAPTTVAPATTPLPTVAPDPSTDNQRTFIPPSQSSKDTAQSVEKQPSDLRYSVLHTYEGESIKNTFVITQTDYNLSAGRLTVLFDQLNNADSLDSPLHVIVNDVDLGTVEASDANAMVKKTFDVGNLRVGENIVEFQSERPQTDSVNYGIVLDIPATTGTAAANRSVQGALPMTGANDLTIILFIGGSTLILSGLVGLIRRKRHS